ncbi:MAG: hypothetical protein ACOCUF_01165 [Patescibacteria group bacterium]
MTEKLAQLEDKILPKEISIVVLSEYTQAEEFPAEKINKNFDIILLDRDCKLCGSFHVIFDDLNFDPQKIISISSTPEWNEHAKSKGVERIVHKDFQDLEIFGTKVIREIKDLI